MGNALAVPLSAAHPLKDTDQVTVKIQYKTTPNSTALGWLEKEWAMASSCCLDD